MKPKDDWNYLRHMRDVADKTIHNVAGLSRPQFDGDENLQLAVTHLIQTIGEAARLVSPEFRDQHPEIPWHRITGMRHRLVHDYMSVDFDVVWKVATTNLSPLWSQLDLLIKSNDQSHS